MTAPFIKWVGGKRKLVPFLKSLLPPGTVKTYYEPFIGGGALFFSLAFDGKFEKAVINDWNVELVNAYRIVQNPGKLTSLITALRVLHDEYHVDKEGTYYREREKDPSELGEVAQAARFLFLNRTGFNGLYRVNRKGKFNVPFGKHENPPILQEEALRSCCISLLSATIRQGDFESAVSDAQSGDVAYFDPPYVPLTKTSSFTSYTENGFGDAEQRRLAACFRTLAARGVRVLLSNSDTPYVRELYEGFTIHPVMMARAINSKGSARGAVSEVVVVG